MKYLLMLGLLVVFVLVLGARRGRARDTRAQEARAPMPPKTIVRCAECGMHLPVEEALPGQGGAFCGAAHRASFEARQGQA